MGRFANLVDTPKGIESFKARYHIPTGVSIRYYRRGEWHALRQEGEAVIPIITFIEGGMRISMGRVTRDYLIVHRLSPSQCAPNMFRILGSVDALNKKMNVNLTHHNINWVYNHHKLTSQGYYMKTRVPAVKLISCLPDSNKSMDKNSLIISREWHDELHCPTRDGTPGGMFRSRFITLIISPFVLTLSVLTSSIFTCKLVLILSMLFSNSVFTFGEFADKYSTIPNLNLVNKPDLVKILKAEIFVHTIGQLRATHLSSGVI